MDGWAYCFAAGDGRLLWRFRAAPEERVIPVYGRLSSTWPVSSNVLVQDGNAYLAAGIVSHDGTHLYALDAADGSLIWQNSDSGNLVGADGVTGVSVQGHLLYHNDSLYLAGGNVVSPAVYDASTGECQSTLEGEPDGSLDDHWQKQRSSRGSDLFLIRDRVVAGGRMMYSPAAQGPPSRYLPGFTFEARLDDLLIRGTDRAVARVLPGTDEQPSRTAWLESRFSRVDAIVLAANAVLAAGVTNDSNAKIVPKPVLRCLDPEEGHEVWSTILPAEVIGWGLSVDRRGRVLVSLADGRLQCYASSE
jgi:outer membrane protein assembly factor BamB